MLGIVGVLVIPSLLKNSSEKQNVTKVRKALSNYEKIVEQMRINEGLTSVEGTAANSLNGFSSKNNYNNGKSYFKIKKEDEDTNYLFKTYDNLWWNIQNMNKPIISLTDECKNSTPKTIKTDACYNKSFYLTAELDISKGNAFLINNEDGDAYDTLVFAKIIAAKTPQELALKNFMKNTGYKCSCTGTNCCSSSCSGQACVQQSVKCTDGINGGWNTGYKNMIDIKSNCSQYILYDKNNTKFATLGINDNVIAYRIEDKGGVLSITKNPDGTYIHWYSGYFSAPLIKYITYDTNWNPTKFQSDENTYVCTKDSCNYKGGVNFNTLTDKYKYGVLYNTYSHLDSLGTGAYSKDIMFYFAEEIWK